MRTRADDRTAQRVSCAGVRQAVDSQQAVWRDPGNMRERAFQSVGGREDGGAQRIGRLEDEERPLAGGEQTLEVTSRARDGVARHHEVLDGEIVRNPQRAERSGDGEKEKGERDPAPQLENAPEDPQSPGRGGRTHRKGSPAGRVRYRRSLMIA
jgi:hypothetical protein